MRRRRGSLSMRRLAIAAVAGCWLTASPSPSAALEWQWGELVGRLDSFFSVGVSIRTQEPDCSRLPNLPQNSNNPGGCVDPGVLAVNGNLVNADDGNLNWDKWQVFSLVAKGSHELELHWRSFGAFTRVSYFGDAIQARSDTSDRTDLPDKARFRKSVLKGGVVGAQFRVLDAYLYDDFNIGERHFHFRFGNQVVNWGESTFTQGGINATNTIDVTSIRLPGSDIREALIPAPIVKLGGDLIGALSFEAYYQFVWRKFEIDPPGTFFSTSDQVGRGAQGFFTPLVGDPGSEPVIPASPLFPGVPACGGAFPDCTAEDILARGVFGGAGLLGDNAPSDQGQYGVALRYYLDTIETELGLYYLRFHAKQPSVGFQGSTLMAGDGAIGYFRDFPEGIDLYGLSFNTVVAGFSIAGEVSYRPDEPLPIASALPDLTTDLLQQGPGGTFTGYVREDRIVGILNAVYVVGPGTPLFGRVLQLIRAQDVNALLEVGVQHFPEMSDTCPSPQLTPAERALRDCIAYALPIGVDEATDTQVSYTLRVDAAYHRVFGSPITLRPIVSFRHDAYGVAPGNGSLWTEKVKQIGLTLEATYLERWKGSVSYSNAFGGDTANASNDRDFLSISFSVDY